MDDDTPKGARMPDAGIRNLYTLENRWQAWLDVEVALARAQADLGIVPKECAEQIARHAKLELLDRARIDEADKRTGHTIVPLVWELSRVVGEPAGGCIGARPRRTSCRPATSWCCGKRIPFSSNSF